jgi:hypothetical protein
VNDFIEILLLGMIVAFLREGYKYEGSLKKIKFRASVFFLFSLGNVANCRFFLIFIEMLSLFKEKSFLDGPVDGPALIQK